MKIILEGTPRTKKNSPRIVAIGRGHKLLPSRAYMDYARACAIQIRALGFERLGITAPVNVACMYYMPTKRRVDLVNLLDGTCDILKDCGVVLDDNSGIIVAHDGSRVMYDKQRPRVEIDITEVEPW